MFLYFLSVYIYLFVCSFFLPKPFQIYIFIFFYLFLHCRFSWQHHHHQRHPTLLKVQLQYITKCILRLIDCNNLQQLATTMLPKARRYKNSFLNKFVLHNTPFRFSWYRHVCFWWKHKRVLFCKSSISLSNSSIAFL